ncbi:amidohydrolase family protein [Pseudarthrobacter sp. S9]|uniref:amidohydrolase family protein n=1 Tax=Pseudarthrobacter sp. S9 TaxID=3418421 RepID=UPI003D0252C0
MCEVVDGADDLLLAVRHRFRTGASAIKLMTSGGVISPVDPLGVPQYSAAEIRVMMEEASLRGSNATAHAYSPEAIRHSVLNGVRCIEHGNLPDAETARLMAENEVSLVPTVVTYDAMDRRGAEIGLTDVGPAKNREVLEAGRNAVGLAGDAGVRIGFGTDFMGELEDEQLEGLRLQCDALGVFEACDRKRQPALHPAAGRLSLPWNPFVFAARERHTLPVPSFSGLSLSAPGHEVCTLSLLQKLLLNGRDR